MLLSAGFSVSVRKFLKVRRCNVDGISASTKAFVLMVAGFAFFVAWWWMKVVRPSGTS